MNMKEAANEPLILEIKGNSLDDGPGIRTVVFFKGCPLSCAWCHNPESKMRVAEISFDGGECVDCGACVKACPEGALDKKNDGFIDRDRCSLCFACVDACPSGALSRVGKSMSINDILAAAQKDIPFFKTSGGGVTLSGGEPTLFMDYAAGLARSLRERGIHVLLETCGLFNHESFIEKLYPHLDLIYFDMKIFDPESHKRFCGAGNRVILENLARLVKLHQEGGTAVLPRIPLVPGITDTDENCSAIAGFLSSMEIYRAVLLSYNPLWREKCGKIGVPNPLGDDPAMATWMEKDRVAAVEGIFRRYGVET